MYHGPRTKVVTYIKLAKLTVLFPKVRNVSHKLSRKHPSSCYNIKVSYVTLSDLLYFDSFEPNSSHLIHHILNIMVLIGIIKNEKKLSMIIFLEAPGLNQPLYFEGFSYTLREGCLRVGYICGRELSELNMEVT